MSNHSKRPVRTYESAAKRLFANGEDGTWFDPSDGRTMFQDSQGKTPSGVDDVVGLMLDKSKGALDGRGPNLIADDQTWTVTTGWSQVDDYLVSVNGINYGAYASVLTADKFYYIEFEVFDYASGTVDVRANTNGVLINATADGVYSGIRLANGGPLYFMGNATFNGKIRNVVVQELPGNHAVQDTTASKPILREDSNGNPYLEFDGIDDILVAAKMDGNIWLPPSSACVAVTVDTTGNGDIIDSQTVRHQIGLREVGPDQKWELYGGTIQYANPSTNVPAFPSDQTIITAEFSNSAATVTVDGVRAVGGSSGTQGIPAVADLYIGGNPLYASESWDGGIYQIIYVNRAITAEERDLLETRVYKEAGVTP